MVIEKEIDRILTLLRNKIREQSFTQLEVQEALGWGRSYISQLLTKQKSLRVEQVLRILSVIGVDPAAFYAELYHFGDPEFGFHAGGEADGQGRGMAAQSSVVNDLRRDFDEQRQLFRGLIRSLVDKNLITLEELTSAMRATGELEPLLNSSAPAGEPTEA